MVRRVVAGVAILVVVILMILGIHSCQVSSRNSALKTYDTGVASLIQRSDNTGGQMFRVLSAGNLAKNEQSAQTSLFNIDNEAKSELSDAQNLSVPDQVTSAQQNFVLTLSLRQNGISDIATNLGKALNRSTAQDGVNAIAVDMQKFLASDVVYTTQTAPGIAAALHAAGIAVNGTIKATNFLPDLAWLVPTDVASKIGATVASSSSGTCPSVCGHMLNSVSVGGVPLSTGGQTVPASPAPTFTANFTNTGQNTETGVPVKVTVTTSSGTTITQQQVVPVTKAGQTYTVQITLPRTPPAGQASVVVTVEKVSGEANIDNNTLTFPVTFD
jgi:hypothetical protein